MPDIEALKLLCYDDRGQPLKKPDCRAAMINHLILEEMLDIDEAEDTVERTLTELNLWQDDEPKSEDAAP